MTPRSRAGLAVAYAALFGFLGISTPFFPLWLADRGFEARAIAACGSAILFGAALGQLALPYAALSAGVRAVAILAAGCALAATSMLVTVTSPLAILTLSGLAGLCTGAAIPLIDALAIAHRDADYGRVRAAGSLGFAVASIASGVAIDRFGAGIVVPLEAGSLAIMLGGVLAVGRPVPAPGDPAAAATRVPVARRDVAATLRRTELWLLMLAVAIVNASHAYYYLFANLHWTRDLGYEGATTGLLWATAVAAEIAVFMLFGMRQGLRWAAGLILAGAAAGVIRWGLTSLDPPLAILFGLQMLHGLTFGATLLGGMQGLRLLVDPRLAPAVLGVFAAMVHGVVIGGVTMLLGYGADVGGQRDLLVMAAIAAAGGVFGLGFALTGSRQRAAA